MSHLGITGSKWKDNHQAQPGISVEKYPAKTPLSTQMQQRPPVADSTTEKQPDFPLDPNEELANDEFTDVDPSQYCLEDIAGLLFKLDTHETIVKDYHCALMGLGILHGRMYLSDKRIMFYSCIFHKEKKIIIDYDKVIRLDKRNTLLLFPDSIQIDTTDGRTFTFGSFSTHDRRDCFNYVYQLCHENDGFASKHKKKITKVNESNSDQSGLSVSPTDSSTGSHRGAPSPVVSSPEHDQSPSPNENPPLNTYKTVMSLDPSLEVNSLESKHTSEGNLSHTNSAPPMLEVTTPSTPSPLSKDRKVSCAESTGAKSSPATPSKRKNAKQMMKVLSESSSSEPNISAESTRSNISGQTDKSQFMKMGVPITNGAFNKCFKQFKDDCDGKKEILHAKFNCSVKTFFQCFVSDDASWPVEEFHKIRKDTEVKVTHWEDTGVSEESNATRKITLKAKVNAPIKMGPDMTRIEKKQQYTARFVDDVEDEGVALFTLDTSVNTLDVPYGDTFIIEERWLVAEKERGTCDFYFLFKVNFVKSCWFKSMIESASTSQSKEAMEMWVKLAKKHLKENPDVGGGDDDDEEEEEVMVKPEVVEEDVSRFGWILSQVGVKNVQELQMNIILIVVLYMLYLQHLQITELRNIVQELKN